MSVEAAVPNWQIGTDYFKKACGQDRLLEVQHGTRQVKIKVILLFFSTQLIWVVKKDNEYYHCFGQALSFILLIVFRANSVIYLYDSWVFMGQAASSA